MDRAKPTFRYVHVRETDAGRSLLAVLRVIQYRVDLGTPPAEGIVTSADRLLYKHFREYRNEALSLLKAVARNSPYTNTEAPAPLDGSVHDYWIALSKGELWSKPRRRLLLQWLIEDLRHA